jgi:hypothetical protein
MRWRRRAAAPLGAPGSASIFLSFTSAGSATAGAVTEALEAAGHRVWRFTEDISVGVNWLDEMIKQVVPYDLVVFLASRTSARNTTATSK